MELSIRLEAIAACVKPGLTIADIGTDHGYLPIELIRRGICPKVMACDVRKGPLERAQEHIVQAGLSQQKAGPFPPGSQVRNTDYGGANI